MCIRKIRNDKGATVVEFALVLPFFFLLIFGVLEFGRFFFVEHTLQYATREGMRLALVGRTLNDEHGNPMSREASIIQTIKDKASLAVNPSSLSIYIFPIGNDYADPSDWLNLPANAGEPGSYVRVKTRYTYEFLTPLMGAFFSGGKSIIESQGTYRNELFDT